MTKRGNLSNMAEKSRTENAFLMINTFVFIGGLFCIVLDYPIPGIILLLCMTLLLPISSLILSYSNLHSIKAENLKENEFDLLKQEHKKTLLLLEECKKKLSVCEKYSIIPLYQNKELHSYNLVSFLQEIIDDLIKKNNPNEVHIDMVYEVDKIPVTINSSCMRLIFYNILDNSLKYAPFESKINITLSQVDDHVLLIVKDNGLGYTIENTMDLFQLNYQGLNRLSGYGLGLTQAKAAAEACNAQIWCKTAENKGFAVYLQFIEKESEKCL